MLSDKTKEEIQKLKARYPHPNSALLPALALAQKEKGWLSPETLEEVAGAMGISPAQAGSVASFYTMFNRRPVGKYLIQVCTNIACSLLGAEHIMEHLERRLGIGVGETTSDGMFTLLEVECLGSCGTAPMMQVNEVYHENLTSERVDEILAELRKQ